MNEVSLPDITGVILVGGKSRRMGRDKAFLRIAGQTPLRTGSGGVQGNLRPDRSGGRPGGALRRLRSPRLAGHLSRQRPRRALYGALPRRNGICLRLAHAISPFRTRRSSGISVRSKPGFDAVVPKLAHGFEPLFALYAKSCLGADRGNFWKAVTSVPTVIIPQVRVRYVKDEELAPLDRDGRSFVNVNTPAEYEKIIKGRFP